MVMKDRFFVLIIVLLTLQSNPSYGQSVTIADGGWHQATTWSNNQVPDTNTDVIIRHTVDIYNNGGCRNLVIDSSGLLFNGLIKVYGSLKNYGFFDAYRNASSYDGIQVRDSILNFGKLHTEILWLWGNREHVITSKDTIRIADMSSPDSLNPVKLAGTVIFKGGWILLHKARLSFSDTLTLVNTTIDGGIIDGSGAIVKGEPGLFGWSGASSFNPQHTTLRNLRLTGANNLYGNGTGIWGLKIAENVINRGAIYDRVLGQPEYTEIYITNSFINEGSFNIAQRGLTLHISGDYTINRGLWQNYKTLFEDNGADFQYISMPTDSAFRGGVEFVSDLEGTSYQWTKNGYSIAGATTRTLLFTGLSSIDAGSYRAKVVVNDSMLYSRTIVVSAVSDIADETIMPAEFVLKQNYPNPFNPGTIIHFSLPETGFTRGVVYDILGREIKTLVNGIISAGSHRIDFNASGLPTGVYFFRLQTENNISVIKMIVEK